MFIRFLIAIATTLLSAQAFAQSADEVRVVQSFLRMVQSPKLSIDGAAGAGTKEAATSFLKESGLQFSGNSVAAVRGYLDADQTGIHGVFSGTYRCSQAVLPMTLTIFERRGHQLAVHEFGRYGDKSSPFGVYTHYVTKDRTTDAGTKLVLKPRKWLKRPKNYSMVRMKGNLNSNLQTLSGTLLHRDCGKFNLTRVTSEFAAPRAVSQSNETKTNFATAAKQSKSVAKAKNVAANSNTATPTTSGFDGLDRVRRLDKGDNAVFEHKLGIRLRDVFGNWEKYRKLKAASGKGDPDASFELAQGMIKAAQKSPGSRFNDAIYAQSTWWLSVSAKNGNNSALLILAEMVEAGEGVEKNMELAKDMYSYLGRNGDERGNVRLASLERKLQQEAAKSDQQAVRRSFQVRIKWDRRLAYYETITSMKPYFFEEDREDIVPLLPDEAIILVIEDLEVNVHKTPGKRATYHSEKFDNIVFVRQERKGEEIFLAQFSDVETGITYYLLFELNEVAKSTGNPSQGQKFFLGNSRMYPHLFVVAGRRRAGKGYVDHPSALEDKMGEKYPGSFTYVEFGNQVVRDFDWGKLPADNLHNLLPFADGAYVIRQEDDTGVYPQLVIVNKSDKRDMAKYEAMQKDRAIQLAKIRARPKESCLQTSVRGRFSKTMNLVGTLTDLVVGSRGSIFPKLKCDGQWCYASNGLGGARISLIPVGTPDCDPISDTTSSCTFSTEFGTGVGGVNLPFDNPIAKAILERAMKNQPLGRGKADFDLEKCEIIGPMEYRNPEGETFVFN